MKDYDCEKLLDEFIQSEVEKSLAGSGDDMFYADQITKYVNDQRGFWIDFVKFMRRNKQ